MTAASDPPDEIEASRAPLLDHLTELRNRLGVAVLALVVAFVACFPFAQKIFLFLVEPFKHAIEQAHGPEAVKDGVKMVFTHAFGQFFVNMKVALFAAIIIAFPVIAYQAYAFVAPGLYKSERRAAAPFLVAAPVMFLVGAAFVFFIAMPFALRFALQQEVNTGGVQISYLPKVDEYLGLVTTLVLAFGFVFQIPVVLSLLASSGVLGASTLRKGRRYAIVGIAAFSALVTPPDPFSMMMMAVPVYCLYEASIWIVWFIEKTRAKAEAAPSSAPAP
ncbi:MAG: twin-arginine translocase subunit TatC [Hyphomonadaceae bacterium]|nr:twin-arginine translocase subunit TatC [Hyphomonadaceae bacterium]